MVYTDGIMALSEPEYGDDADIAVINSNSVKIDDHMTNAFNNLAEPFNPNKAYEVGEIVVYEKVTYIFTAAKSAGAWDATKVEVKPLGTAIFEKEGGGDSLSDLTDTDIDSPVEDEVLTWDGTAWVNAEGTPAVTKAATGNPIEITDGASAPLVKCVTAITGSQDLHGYDKPWVGGAGKNKLPLTVDGIKEKNTSGTWNGNIYTKNKGTFEIITDNGNNVTGIKVNGTFNAQTLFEIGNYISDSATSIIYSGVSGGSAETYSINSNIGGQYQGDIYNGDSSPRQIPASTSSYYLIVVREGYVANNVMFYPMFRLSTVSDATFAPYSNICPITAYNQSTISVGGKNRVDVSSYPSSTIDGIIYTNNGNGTISMSGLSTSASWRVLTTFKAYANHSYILSGCPTNEGTYHLTVNGNGLEWRDIIDKGDGATFTAPITGTYNLVFRISNVNISINEMLKPMVRLAEGTDSNFEPYTKTDHTATFSNAIYRGSEDVVNGTVTTEWGMIASYAGETLSGEWISDRDEYAPGTTPTTGAQVAYELATPTTSPITPTNLPIKSLNGYNHIESSTGDMEVEYITEGYQPIVNLIQSSQHVYSTQERIVGKWVDGSDIYERSIDLGSFSVGSGGNHTVEQSTDMKLLIDYDGYVIESDIVYALPDPSIRIKLTIDKSLIFTGEASWDVTSGYLTIRYTKSTATTRNLSKGTTDSLKADLSEVKDEGEEILKGDEKAIKKAQSEDTETKDDETEGNADEVQDETDAE